jgi:hypothetical protein
MDGNPDAIAFCTNFTPGEVDIDVSVPQAARLPNKAMARSKRFMLLKCKFVVPQNQQQDLPLPDDVPQLPFLAPNRVNIFASGQKPVKPI